MLRLCCLFCGCLWVVQVPCREPSQAVIASPGVVEEASSSSRCWTAFFMDSKRLGQYCLATRPARAQCCDCIMWSVSTARPANWLAWCSIKDATSNVKREITDKRKGSKSNQKSTYGLDILQWTGREGRNSSSPKQSSIQNSSSSLTGK